MINTDISLNLLKGDCLDLLKTIESDSVDLVLTDPPYGLIKGLKLECWSKKTAVWDETLDMELVFRELNRICKVKSSILLFSQGKYTFDLYNKQHNNLPFCYRLIWEKNNFANPYYAKKAPVSYCEDILVFRKNQDDVNLSSELRDYSKMVLKFINLPLKEIFKLMGNGSADHFFRWKSVQHELCTEDCYNKLIEIFNIDKMSGFLPYKELKRMQIKIKPTFNLGEGYKYKSNILKYSKEATRYHPTQKPVSLLEDLIKTYSNEGDVVLDFTMGSGSTGVACKNLKRSFIGIERDESFFNVATRRISSNENKSKNL